MAHYRERWGRRVRITVHGIEPASKQQMSPAERVAFQAEVGRQLRAQGRAPFRGPLVLDVTADTTVKTPPHAQTFAKNLLDLLGQAPDAGADRRGLLYADDRQVHGLSVRCNHGSARARIDIQAARLSDYCQDLAWVTSGLDQLFDDESEERWDHADDNIANLRDYLDHEGQYRARLGDRTYEAFRDFTRRQVQQYLLRGSEIGLLDLAALLRVGAPKGMQYLDTLVNRTQAATATRFRHRAVRIHLDELPRIPGTSAAYKQSIDEQIAAYLKQYGWILRPLRMPVGLQVVVRPPLPGRAQALNDLDNVVRTHLVPRILSAFVPPSNYVWMLDPAARAEWEVSHGRLPASTRVGLTRIEAWQIPRDAGDNSHGFVSAALVEDLRVIEGVFSRVDRVVERGMEARRAHRASAY